MRINKDAFINFYRLNILFFKNIFKDYKIYLVSILIPLVLSFLLYWMWGTANSSAIFAPQMFGFISIGSIIIPFYISILTNEWKSTNFLKQIKSSKISIISLNLSLCLINSFFCLLSSVLCLILAMISLNFIYAFPIKISVFSDIDWYIWLDYFLIILFGSFLILLSFFVVSNLFKNKYLSLFANIILMIVFLVGGDCVVIPNITSKNLFVIIIQYLIPIKYYFWTIFMFTSYQFIDSYGMGKILSTNDLSNQNISFNNIIVPIIMMLIMVVLFLLILKKIYVWGYKK